MINKYSQYVEITLIRKYNLINKSLDFDFNDFYYGGYGILSQKFKHFHYLK